ncbi:hypothetical protein WDZ92_39810 [Nostoc sp. NIES-2111]
MQAVLVLCDDGQMIARAFDNPESVSVFYERVADAVLSRKPARMDGEIRNLIFGWRVEVEGADTPKDAAEAARAGAGEVIEVTQEPSN